MLDTITKKRIDDCRDILVGKLPDPKAQIEQITIGLIYKFMDDMDKEAIDLGGKSKFFSDYTIPDPKDENKEITIPFSNYSWERLFDTKVTAPEMLRLYSEAIEGMEKNPNIPQLFRDIFNNAYLPYRDPETLKLFLKTIGEFEYTHSEKLGDAFEYLLSVMGSQGDAGQFRTPRHIIDFLVAIVDPSKTDTIMDPACGTAGFLISAFKYLKQKNNNQFTPEEQKKLIKNFVGYDISPDMVRLSLVNLYLHGFTEPHIFEYDTLSSEDRWNENFDVILANPPFMSPKGGIRPHKKFTIASKRSEVLFVDYIAEHLNPKGRAGIIVPEGIIFQNGTAYKDLRKMLVDNQLYAVISLPAGVFNPYSGVKTSILLLDSVLAKKSNKILFIKIDNDGYSLGSQRGEVKGGQLEEAIKTTKAFKYSITDGTVFENTTIAHSVDKKEISKNGDYNLSGERYKVISVVDSNYDMVSLSDKLLFDVVSGGTPSSKEETYWNGEINWATLVDLPSTELISNIYSTTRKITEEGLKNSSAKLLPLNSVIVSTRATIGRIAINKIECSTNQGFKNIIIKNIERVNTYFVALMMTKLVDKMNAMATGGTFKELSTNSFRTLEIPLPPLSIQEEIVSEIEGYQKIIDGANMVINNYIPKIEIAPDWEMVELGQLLEKNKKSVLPSELEISELNYLGLNNISQGTGELVGEIKANPKDIKSTKNVFEPNHILYGKLRPNLNKVYFSEIEGICSTDIFVLKKKVELNPKLYSYYFLSERFNKEVLKGIKGAQLPRVGYPYFSSIKIPFPPIETQNEIVERIEDEQKLVNANKELIEIFKIKIKDRIAKIWGE